MDLKRMKDTLKRHEGTGIIKNGRYFPYRCTAGKLTIGIGRNLDDNGLTGIEVEFLLENDIMIAVSDCKKLFFNYNLLGDIRQEVLINMIFNLGYNRLSKFKKFIGAVSKEDFVEASKQMKDSAWYTQVGKRAHELKDAMLFGEFSKT